MAQKGWELIRLSTRGRYGTRIMLELARHYGKGPLLLKEIARKQEVSVGYLEQIMPSLRSSGLVQANRGAHGGYFLAKAPCHIMMKEIIESLEGEISLLECIGNPQICQRSAECAAKDLWEELNDQMLDFLGSKSLQDLLDMQVKKEAAALHDYDI